jgi:hypothetical protein
VINEGRLYVRNQDTLLVYDIKAVLPQINFSDTTTSLGPTGGNLAGAGFSSVFDSYQWFTSATSARGKHTLKYGGDVRFLRETSINYGNAAGTFNAPVTAPTTSNFGQITSQANAPRSVQFAARLMW